MRVREAGAEGVLTYKGLESRGKHKDREELQVHVSDPGRMREILARLEFVPGFRYEKYRAEYQRAGERGVATLDETPVGVYIELEGSPGWIDRNARRLGFRDSDYVTTSYYGLYVEHCRNLGLQPTNMTFD